jgi:hypothetical protein
MGEWISVKNSIPEKNKDVLVFLSRGEIQIRHRLDEEYLDDPDIYNRISWSDQGIINDVTHWMPLPEAPSLCALNMGVRCDPI